MKLFRQMTCQMTCQIACQVACQIACCVAFMSCVAVLSCFIALPQGWASEKTYTNSIGMEFVLIPSGSFMMGAGPNFEDASSDETPRHHVTISKAFYLGKFEVTQSQWVAVIGDNHSKFKGRSNPVDTVSWDYARYFVRKLNQMEGTDKYRLPTEAEWEYAARAGTESTYSFGDDASDLGGYAWYWDNSGEKTHPVGQKGANAWGLHDMHGNVREWVQDWYGENYYSQRRSTDPQGPSSGKYRVLRGGGWIDFAGFCRAAHRDFNTPDGRNNLCGFRVLLEQ